AHARRPSPRPVRRPHNPRLGASSRPIIGDGKGRLMRRFLLTLGGLGLAAMTLAGPRLSYASGGAPVPPEWVGIWTSVDSIYDCTTGALMKVVERTDTLCAGQEIGDDPNAPPHLSATCSGSADAGHIQVHCGASGLCGEACTFDYTSDLDETRTG